MCETIGNLTRMCTEHVDERIAKHERNYPGFAKLYASKTCCWSCLDSDVADAYGWRVASEDWGDYRMLRYLSGDQ